MQYLLDPLGYLDNAYQQFGDIFYTPVISSDRSLLIISDPQGLQQLFSQDSRQFYTPSNQYLQLIVGDNSLFCLEGDRHKRERKLLMPPFHGDKVRRYGETICELTEQIFSQLKPNQTFSARHLMQSISLEIILTVVFGIHQGERFETLKTLITELMDLFNSPVNSSLLFFPFLKKDWGGLSPWVRFRRLKEQIKQLVYAEIEERRLHYDPDATDILSLLMSTCDEEGKVMSDPELYDQLMTLLLAGHETTANTISWALYWVHKQPDILEKLRQEIANLGESPEPMTLFKLPFLTAVCYEALRIYPVVILTVPREVKEPVELMGYHLEPGTRVRGCIYLTHQREDLYPHPREFRPERFLNRQYTSYEFFPFGGGARRCIGEALGMLEMKLVLATIVSHYHLELLHNRPLKPKRRGVTMSPESGVEMIFRGNI